MDSVAAASAPKYSFEERGKLYTESYRVYFKNEFGQVISPFHDIPLCNAAPEAVAMDGAEQQPQPGDVFNMVVEVPKWTNAKMEISKSYPLNPIVQDVKKGKVRFVGNVFPHRGYIWNYGAIPQTWEDPKVVHPGTNAGGDNDPIDVCDISNQIVGRGSVVQVKVLGILAMVDEGETDWKVMAINTQDPLAAHMNDIADVEKHKPGLLHATVEWFKYYKVPDGKPTNNFGYNGRFKNKQFALGVINETHEHWKKMIEKSGEDEEEGECDIARQSVSVNESPYLITSDEAQKYVDESEEYDSLAAGIRDTKPFESFYINAAPSPLREGRVTHVKTAKSTRTVGDVSTVVTTVTTTRQSEDATGETVSKNEIVVTTVVENSATGERTESSTTTEELVVASEEQEQGEAAADTPAETEVAASPNDADGMPNGEGDAVPETNGKGDEEEAHHDSMTQEEGTENEGVKSEGVKEVGDGLGDSAEMDTSEPISQ